MKLLFVLFQLIFLNISLAADSGAHHVYTSVEKQYVDLRYDESTSAVIFYDRIEELKNIHLNLKDYNSYYFKPLYLVPKNVDFFDIKSSALVNLIDLYQDGASLSVHTWDERSNAFDIIGSESLASSQYFVYRSTTDYRVSLKWSSKSSIDMFSSTRIAVSMSDEHVEVMSYSGAMIDYSFKRTSNQLIIDIKNAYSEYEVHGLTLGRIRSRDQGLYLEVHDFHDVGADIKTSFVVSLYGEMGEGQMDLGSFEISKDKMIYEPSKKMYKIFLGKLNFPTKFKMPQSKLKIYLSTFRKFRGQTRSKVLSGLYRI